MVVEQSSLENRFRGMLYTRRMRQYLAYSSSIVDSCVFSSTAVHHYPGINSYLLLNSILNNEYAYRRDVVSDLPNYLGFSMPPKHREASALPCATRPLGATWLRHARPTWQHKV